jgi:hypothetical protein
LVVGEDVKYAELQLLLLYNFNISMVLFNPRNGFGAVVSFMNVAGPEEKVAELIFPLVNTIDEISVLPPVGFPEIY